MNLEKISTGLTESQSNAIKQLFEFLDTDDHCFILKGYAGTGKTFLISRLTKYLDKHEIPFILAAPTGRAARMLSQKTDKKAVTIHSLIYASPEELLESAHSTDRTILNFSIKKFTQPQGTIFIIDESSMVHDNLSAGEFLNFGTGRLLFDLLNYTSLNFKQDNKRTKQKIIFVGDPAQLPPVNQKNSPALSSDYLYSEFGLSADETELTEVVRQSGESGILNFATTLRNTLSNEQYRFPQMLKSLDTKVVSSSEFIDVWKHPATKNIDEVAVIVRTNDLALRYNRQIRNYLFHTKSDTPRKGDRLLVINNNNFYNFLNGDIVEVAEIVSETEKLKATNPFDGKEYELCFRDVLLHYKDSEGKEQEKYVKILENMLSSKTGGLGRNEHTILRIISLDVAGYKYSQLNPKKKSSQKAMETKKKVEEAMKDSEYLNALQVKFGYALTCHKAQGGEWKNVFLDFNSYGPIHDEDYIRWAYTAVTRTKETLYAINPPGIFLDQIPEDDGNRRYVPFVD